MPGTMENPVTINASSINVSADDILVVFKVIAHTYDTALYKEVKPNLECLFVCKI